MGVPYWTKQYQSSDEILCPKEYFKFIILDTDYIEFKLAILYWNRMCSRFFHFIVFELYVLKYIK